MKIKKALASIPLMGPLLVKSKHLVFGKPKGFGTSEEYWRNRYAEKGSSGDGSYRKLAEFKAEVINDFVSAHGVDTVIEYGCGDGNQLTLAAYPDYLGFDVSPEAVRLCREHFPADNSKRFKLVSDYDGERADLTMSLDVVYHLVEDDVYHDYMARLFDSSDKYVIVYASNREESDTTAPHVRHRKFTDWIEANRSEWSLHSQIPNRYPYVDDTKTGSFADFYIFQKS